MEGKEADRIGATEVDINTLFGLFQIWQDDENISQDDFFVFIQTPSVDRELFLKEYCTYDFKEVGESTVIRFKLN